MLGPAIKARDDSKKGGAMRVAAANRLTCASSLPFPPSSANQGADGRAAGRIHALGRIARLRIMRPQATALAPA